MEVRKKLKKRLSKIDARGGEGVFGKAIFESSDSVQKIKETIELPR